MGRSFWFRLVYKRVQTCYLFWSSGLSSPTRLVALPRPLTGGQRQNIESVNNWLHKFVPISRLYTDVPDAVRCF